MDAISVFTVPDEDWKTAVKNGDLDAVRHMLKDSPVPDYRYDFGRWKVWFCFLDVICKIFALCRNFSTTY